MIDLIIVFIVAAIAMFFWGFLSGFSVSYVSDETWGGRGMLAGIVLDLIYTCITMSGKRQSTFGQRAVGIKVIRSDGSTVEFGTALVRYLVSLISSIVLKLGYFIALFTDSRRTLHDLAAGTVVVDNGYVQANSTPSTFGPKIISATVDSLNTTPTQLKADQPLEEVLDEFWGKAANEFDTSQDKSSWAKAFALAEGNELKAKALYIRFRARSLQAEHDAKNKPVEFEEARLAGLTKEEIEYLVTPIKAIRYIVKYKRTKDQLAHACSVKKIKSVMSHGVLWVSDRPIK